MIIVLFARMHRLAHPNFAQLLLCQKNQVEVDWNT